MWTGSRSCGLVTESEKTPFDGRAYGASPLGLRQPVGTALALLAHVRDSLRLFFGAAHMLRAMGHKQVHKRLGWVLLAVIAVGGALVAAVSVGAITLPGTHSGAQSAQAKALVSPAAKQSAAN